jgi:hypothetical protein
MKPGKIFISHKHQYGSLVQELKRTIETTSRGRIEVIISEELPAGAKWRGAIKQHLDESEFLFLIYGAPYEDWSWCFYEAGYFAALAEVQGQERRIYCIARPNMEAPGPLSDLQMVTDNERLITSLIEIYGRNRVVYDAVELRQSITQATKHLFCRLQEFVSYPRVYFIADDADFGPDGDVPAKAILRGDKTLFTQLFAIGKDTIPWGDIVGAGNSQNPVELLFFSKWVEEMKKIILAARDNRFIAPQTVLLRGSRRVRFLLYLARSQGDGAYSCEFLVIDDVGGPVLALSQQQLALLTSVRLGFRFRYEFLRRFAADPADLSDDQRRAWMRDIPRIVDCLMTESDTRGNIRLEDLQGAFDDEEAERIGRIVGHWPLLQENLYSALGLSPEGKTDPDQALVGVNAERYRLAFEALRLINIEFLSRCCARVSRMMTRPEDDLKKNAEMIEQKVKALSRLRAPPAPPAVAA